MFDFGRFAQYIFLFRSIHILDPVKVDLLFSPLTPVRRARNIGEEKVKLCLVESFCECMFVGKCMMYCVNKKHDFFS